MDQADFEAQAEVGECPTCAIQKKHDEEVARRQAELKHFDHQLLDWLDQGKKL
jgi:hypothetical protein